MDGSVGVKVYDDIGYYFQKTHEELRWGRGVLPILFNIVADMLAILMARDREDGEVGGLLHI